MTTRLTIDAGGRIVLPKPLRKLLGLAAGDTLELNSEGDNITLRPLRAVSPLAQEKGVWVFRTGQPLSASVTDTVLDSIRDERDRQNIGEAQ